MNAECYCNFQSNFNVGSRVSCFVTIGKDTSRQVAQGELRNFIGYLQQCLQRINVYLVSILVLLYRIRSFFHLILFSYFIDFVSFRYILLSYFTDFVGFRFLTLQISLHIVFLLYRFCWILFQFLSLPVPLCSRKANSLMASLVKPRVT